MPGQHSSSDSDTQSSSSSDALARASSEVTLAAKALSDLIQRWNMLDQSGQNTLRATIKNTFESQGIPSETTSNFVNLIAQEQSSGSGSQQRSSSQSGQQSQS